MINKFNLTGQKVSHKIEMRLHGLFISFCFMAQISTFIIFGSDSVPNLYVKILYLSVKEAEVFYLA